MKRADLALHFADGLRDFTQVDFGLVELAQGLFLLSLEAGDPGGFLENHTAVFGAAAQYLSDMALSHDAVAGPAYARSHEKLLDILQAAGCLIEEILAGAIPENPARHRHFIKKNLQIGRPELLLIHIADREGDLRHGERTAGLGAVKNNISHLSAAERLGGLLSQNPADGIGYVGFAAAVGTDNSGDARREVQACLICKGFETEYCQILQIHVRMKKPKAFQVKLKTPASGLKLFTEKMQKPRLFTGLCE